MNNFISFMFSFSYIKKNLIMNMLFEETKPEHLSDLLKIYNEYTGESYSTLYEKPLTLEQFRNLVFFNDQKYKSFTIIISNIIVGFVVLAKYKNNIAYDSTAEVAIYLHSDFTNKGIGKKALAFIEEYAKQKNIHSIIATISSKNIFSIKLFESSGYKKCAHFFEVAKKNNIYLDIINYQKIL